MFPEVQFRLLGFLDIQNPTAITRAQVEEWEATGLVRYLGATDDVTVHYVAADCVTNSQIDYLGSRALPSPS
jgi:hypothetical protein